jgi:hypothetical protein
MKMATGAGGIGAGGRERQGVRGDRGYLGLGATIMATPEEHMKRFVKFFRILRISRFSWLFSNSPST